MPDYKKMYSILCGAASDAIDQLSDIPLAQGARSTLQAALSETESLYLEAPYPHSSDKDPSLIYFSSDNEEESKTK